MKSHDSDTWMWEKARELIEQADKVHRGFFRPGRPHSNRPTWEPPVDIFETEDCLWIIAALPGVEPQHTEIVIESGVLTLHGERSLPPPCRRATVHRLEIPLGRFERSIALPPGRFEIEHHELVSGCLFISLKKLT
jgi:HSP20 family molecular chaperone IbpA